MRRRKIVNSNDLNLHILLFIRKTNYLFYLEIILADRDAPRGGWEVNSDPLVDDLIPDCRREIPCNDHEGQDLVRSIYAAPT